MNKETVKKIILVFLIFTLIYTRIKGLVWGLPYAIHPDERNMSVAIEQLQCKITFSFPGKLGQIIQFPRDCMNPHFFAYGQLPLYLGYALIMLYKILTFRLNIPVTFVEATVVLRLIAAIASILSVAVVIRIIKELTGKALNFKHMIIVMLFFTFSPALIQFAHFGTTESLLMFCYLLIIYLSIKTFDSDKYLLWIAIVSGLALAVKTSAILFIMIPATALIIRMLNLKNKNQLLMFFYRCVNIAVLALIVFIVFSPYNFIAFGDFLGSMRYESDVALGRYIAFYTRQFDASVPVIFQLIKVFPYALGWPAVILFINGFFLLPWNKKTNILRLAFIFYFVPNAFVFAKWARFMTPVMPVMMMLAVLFLIEFYDQWLMNTSLKKFMSKIPNKFQSSGHFIFNLSFSFLMTASIIFGLAYMSIYQTEDVRFAASEWIYNNMPENSYILSETANVIDAPVPVPARMDKIKEKSYRYISFNFYDLDQDPKVQADFQEHLAKADYIFVPSRRVFANNTCIEETQNSKLKSQNFNPVPELLNKTLDPYKRRRCEYLNEKYPRLNDYYRQLFSGNLGFEKVAEFSSSPKISLFGHTLLEFPDEQAEETWTVFDHPVFRIYKRVR